MGTSTSFRAPRRPRWSAFLAALLSEAPIERVRSELFNAGNDWQEALAAPGVASYAEALIALHQSLPERVAASERADIAIGALVAEARHASLEVGFSAASSLADRAFARLLLSTVGDLSDAQASTPEALGARWRAARGPEPSDLVARFLGELLGQYARHVTDREAGRLVSQDRGAEASARLTEVLAGRATDIGTSVGHASFATGGPIDAGWADLVSRAFETGRELPRDDG